MDSIVRVGVTFPSELLSDFDRLRVEMGYRSRSKAIQDTVRTFVNEQKWLAGLEGRKIGAIVMIYDHKMKNLESHLTDTQHEFQSIICSTMHVHLSKDRCLETIVVRGEADAIRLLVEKFKARRGVEEVRLNVFSV